MVIAETVVVFRSYNLSCDSYFRQFLGFLLLFIPSPSHFLPTPARWPGFCNMCAYRANRHALHKISSLRVEMYANG